MSDTQDHSKLRWIKGELDVTIEQVHADLEKYMEGAEDTTLMEGCVAKLHQVYGTLQMVQAYGAAMLAEEMEFVARDLCDGAINQGREDAAEALLQGVLKLPDYLEKIQSGGRDHPIIILPLLNDLRASRAQPLLSEAALFAPDLEQRLQDGEVDGDESLRLPRMARKLRHKYHKGLLDWYRETDPVEGVASICRVLHKLEDNSGTEQVRRMFRMARAACTVPTHGDRSGPSIAIKLLLGRVDREIKRIIDEGELPVAEAPAVDVQRNLLYYIASSHTDDELAQELKREFGLDRGYISQNEITAGQKGLEAPNAEVLDTLREAIGADLGSIKDELDIFLRTNSDSPEQLLSLEQPLRRVADTLGMIGQGAIGQRLRRQAESVNKIGNSGETPDEAALMEMAGDIIFVETSLANLTTTGSATEILTGWAADGSAAKEAALDLPAGETDHLVDSVMREARIDLAHVKESVVSFIKTPDKIKLLADVPGRFRSIAGAFEILKLFDVSGLLRAMAGYVDNEIIVKNSVPETGRLNAFADAVTSIEFFMEAVVEGRGVHDEILDVAREALVRLGTEDDLVEPSADDAEETTPTAAHEPETAPQASADKPSLEDISPEILDIFIEEAREELEVIREYLPRWMANQEGQRDSLVTFRRSFHTLKGSGRLVGAKVIGEFAWSIENLLNRVIDETLVVSDVVLELLEQVLTVLPELIDAREDGRVPSIDVQPIMDRAFELATATEKARESKPDQQQTEQTFPLGEEVDEVAQVVAPISMDPALLEIFRNESTTHLDVINRFLDRYRAGETRKLDSEITRAYHTLHGSAHMAEVGSMAALSAALEDYLNDLLEHDQPADEQLVDLIDRSSVQIESILDCINVEEAELPDWKGLLADIERQHAALHQDAEEIIEALPLEQEDISLEEFSIEEAEEVIEALPLDQEDVSLDELSIEDAEEAIEAMPLEQAASPEESVAEEQTFELPSSRPKVEVDANPEQELAEIFLEEAVELMDSIDSALNQWSDNPANLGPVEELQRILHTLKGGARLAGIGAIGDLSHSFESLLEVIGQHEVAASKGMYIFSQSVADRLMNQVEEVREHGSASAAEGLIPQLEGLLSGTLQVNPESGTIEELEDLELEIVAEEPVEAEQNEQHTAEDEAIEDEKAKDEDVEDEEDVEDVEDEEGVEDEEDEEDEEGLLEDSASTEEKSPPPPFLSIPDKAPMPAVSGELIPPEAEVTPQHARQQPGGNQLRVNSDLMDKLVNNAGEISIFRSRLEQQNGALGFNLDELQQTVDRLRNQLRQLEIETETQILFRYDREQVDSGSKAEKFDPLELDRFSNMQQLSRGLMETVGDLTSINELLDEEQRETETLLLQQSRVATDLQDGLLRTRMVSFGQLLPRLRRLVRQTCRSLRKHAELEIVGEGMELDRSILDRMTAPLEHLLRNAISHGIESPEIRQESGKDEDGRVTLNLSREGNSVVITLSDDGAGLNMDAIRTRAMKLGLLADGAEITDDELVQFILDHGFSTADEVSQISGRGVGLDVVASEVKQLGGSLDIQSTPGTGTTFIITLPLTLAITEALLLQLGKDTYAVPHNGVEGVVRISRQQLVDCYEGRNPGYEYAGSLFPVRYLGSILEGTTPYIPEQRKWFPLLLVHRGERRVALHVDEFQGRQQIVVKSVGPQLSTVRWFTGGTILGDGRVALILDVNVLGRMDAAQTVDVAAIVEEAEHQTNVMVVDDSITVRRVTSRLLERHGMQVVTAKDGVDAIAKLQETHPDIMLLDIEMPRMDGFEVARHMMNSEELRDIPIIIITSRSGEKHRTLAMELGVKRYLGKPFQEEELLGHINDLLAEK